jgi:hypothetical protein
VGGQLELPVTLAPGLGEEAPGLLESGVGLSLSPVVLDEVERILTGWRHRPVVVLWQYKAPPGEG